MSGTFEVAPPLLPTLPEAERHWAIAAEGLGTVLGPSEVTRDRSPGGDNEPGEIGRPAVGQRPIRQHPSTHLSAVPAPRPAPTETHRTPSPRQVNRAQAKRRPSAASNRRTRHRVGR